MRQEEAIREWHARQDPACSCRPVYNTARQEVERETCGCPLHCTHDGIAMNGNSWRCGCGKSYEAPCVHTHTVPHGSDGWRCRDCGTEGGYRKEAKEESAYWDRVIASVTRR